MFERPTRCRDHAPKRELRTAPLRMQLQPPSPAHDWITELADDFGIALIH